MWQVAVLSSRRSAVEGHVHAERAGRSGAGMRDFTVDVSANPGVVIGGGTDSNSSGRALSVIADPASDTERVRLVAAVGRGIPHDSRNM